MSLLVMGLTIIPGPRAAFAADYGWVQAAGGNWGDPANWDGGGGEFPNSPDDTVTIDRDLAESAIITLPEEPVTIAGLTLGLGGVLDNQRSWTISGRSPLTFASAQGPVTAQVESGIHTIDAPIQLGSDLIVSAEGTLRLLNSRAVTEIDGPRSLTVERGILDLRARAEFSGGTLIKEGASVIAVRATALGSGPVTIEDGGRLTSLTEGNYVENPIALSGNGKGLGAVRLGTELPATASQIQLARIQERQSAPTFHSGGFSGELTLNADAAIGVTADGVGQISGPIGGAYVLSKVGTGKLELENVNSYAGTRILEGTLLPSLTGGLPPGAPLDLAGGTLELTAAPHELGVLLLSKNSTIRLPEEGEGTLSFLDSSRIEWAKETILTIENWTAGASGGRYKVKFGEGGTALSDSQLNQIRFRAADGTEAMADLVPGGELLPQQ